MINDYTSKHEVAQISDLTKYSTGHNNLHARWIAGVTVPSSVVDLGRENQASRYTRAGNGLSPVVNAYLGKRLLSFIKCALQLVPLNGV